MKEIVIYLVPIVTTLISVIISVITIVKGRKNILKEKGIVEKYLKINLTISSLEEELESYKSSNDKNIIDKINLVNNNVNSLFDELTQSKCKTTIWVIVYDAAVPMVMSLTSMSVDKKSSHEVNFKKTKLADETSLTLLFSKYQDFHLNNDLSKIGGFFPAVPKYKDDRNWRFIFLSTLVVPIHKKGKGTNKDFIYGFLSIDCEKKNAFNKEVHVDIAKQIANSLLSPFIEKWTKRMIANNNRLTSLDT